MHRKRFNDGWFYKHLQGSEEGMPVTLPHDAMMEERRSPESMGGANIGWFEGGDYLYTREFEVTADMRDKHVVFEFEGVYHNAEVYLNGRRAAYRPYGYTNFYVDADPFLKYGQMNELRVIARNSDQPNSRWYTGSGIYRPVNMYVGEKDYILPGGIRIRTVGIRPARVEITVLTSAPGEVKAEILEGERTVAVFEEDSAGKLVKTVEIPDAKLWGVKHPHLYTCRVSFGKDEAQETFGVRELTWDSKKGLAMNGKRIILRGACIHHDNGVLGACAYPEAEERKIRILKENGYNAVRSAHNPCSRALLDACDRLGMLVMDEYVDVWYIHKTEHDYAGLMQKWWKEDLKDMVEKDYNHPSVILYSTGNEVSETAQKQGISLTGQMTRYLHRLDPTRPVTCGINIFFNFLSSIGFGVYSDDKAKKNAEKAARDSESLREGKKKKKPVGSEFYNTMAGIFGDYTMKLGATLYPCDVKTRDAFANMDVAGYNYGILRYKGDLKKYPDRLILGTETFCKDAYDFWEIAKKNPRIIGDFVWAGMDYMGEVGVGSWEYEDYAPRPMDEYGWLSAGSGRINILGKPLAEAAYTRVAFERIKGPVIAVKPVYQKGKHSPSAWKMTEAMESWSWRGCAGWPATVEVYARAAEVELFIENVSVGRKRLKNTCRTTFHTTYQDGEITAVSYDEAGREIGRASLRTAGPKTQLRAVPEQEKVQAGGLVFIPIQYTDGEGILKPMEKHSVKASVKGGKLLGFGNACPFNKDGYRKDTVKTYYGEAMAVVQADGSSDVEVCFTDEKESITLRIPCRA